MDKPFRFGPIALTNTYTTNLLNPPTATGGVNGGSSAQQILLNHIRIVNKTGSDATFRLFLGLTGANTAGTEIIGYDMTVPANDAVDWYAGGQGLVIDSADFLVGGASASTTLTIEGEGSIRVS